MLKSIAEAKRNGFREPLADHYGGEQVTIKGRTLVRGPCVALSMTAWKEKGFTVIEGVEPHAVLHRMVGGQKMKTYPVFRHDQVERRVINTVTGKVVSIIQGDPSCSPCSGKEAVKPPEDEPISDDGHGCKAMSVVFIAGQENRFVVDATGVKVVFNPSEQATYSAMLSDLFRQLTIIGYERPEDVAVFARGIASDDTLWTANGQWAHKHYERRF